MEKTGILEIIKNILQSGEQALGCPLEIEYAINFFNDKIDEFCLLQIKPMLITGMDMKKDLALKKDHQLICKSSLVLGNGLIENIQNIIYVDPKGFDTSKTQDIAKEIEKINARMKTGQSYILIGPGRWGSADPWLGVPVEWDQISKAKVIIEFGMENFPVDPSFGSHFFQNVTSMRIGYFTLNHKNKDDKLNTKWIESQPVKKKTDNLIWIEPNDPIKVIINGQSGKGIITNKTMAKKDIMDEHESSGI